MTEANNTTTGEDAPATGKSRWKPEYNESLSRRRKERYKADPAYREQVKNAARVRYNRKTGGSLSDTSKAIKQNLATLSGFGKAREVFVGRANVGVFPCLTEQELAEVLCRNYQSFQRMVKDGRWPAPVFSSRSGKTRMGVYTLPEAKALASIYDKHYEQSAHYYASHTQTRDALFDAVKAVRAQTELGRWAMETMV